MCDLETLGTRPGCKLLSIGAVVFGPAGVAHDSTSQFYLEVKINDQGDLVADKQTIAWWDQQDPAERDRLFGGQASKPTLRDALTTFNIWLRHLAEVKDNKLALCLWGNGADFDNAILQVAYEAVGAGRPAWEFYNNRCYRTLKNLAPDVKLVRQGTHHNALDDALTQAEHAVRLMRHLGVW